MNEVNNIPQGWTEENLVDNLEAIIDYRGKTPKKSEEGILTLSAKSVKMGYIDYSQAYYISKETYTEFMVRGFPKVGDVLMTTEAPLGCIARLDRDDVAIAQRLLTLRGKKNIIDNEYLRYYLTSRKGQHELQSRASGSTVEGIKRSEFIKVKILMPNYEEQQAIAAILTAFDDKIELLQAQNKTLEELAQTIFKEWFGKYQIGDELPEGWSVGKLGDVTKTVGGTTPSTTNPDFWDGDIYWSSPKDLSSSKGMFLLKTEKKITEVGLSKISSGLLPRKTLLLSSRAPIGYLALTNIELAINQGYIAILPEQYFSNNFMYLWLSENMKLVESASNGSTFMEISKSSFRNIECVIPNQDILEKFESFTNPLFEKVLSNQIQIQTLTQTRDALLPKLMSGEIRVKN